MAAMMGREGSLITAAGEVNPILQVPTNGLLRLRLLNASVSRFYRLQVEQHPMHLIATDGGAISEPVEVKELLLSPGERAEVLIKGDQVPGSYRLLNLPYDRGGLGMMGGMKMSADAGSMKMKDGGMDMGGMKMGEGHSMKEMSTPDASTQGAPVPLATFNYSDTAASTALPALLISGSEAWRSTKHEATGTLYANVVFERNGVHYRRQNLQRRPSRHRGATWHG